MKIIISCLFLLLSMTIVFAQETSNRLKLDFGPEDFVVRGSLAKHYEIDVDNKGSIDFSTKRFIGHIDVFILSPSGKKRSQSLTEIITGTEPSLFETSDTLGLHFDELGKWHIFFTTTYDGEFKKIPIVYRGPFQIAKSNDHTQLLKLSEYMNSTVLSDSYKWIVRKNDSLLGFVSNVEFETYKTDVSSALNELVSTLDKDYNEEKIKLLKELTSKNLDLEKYERDLSRLQASYRWLSLDSTRRQRINLETKNQFIKPYLYNLKAPPINDSILMAQRRIWEFFEEPEDFYAQRELNYTKMMTMRALEEIQSQSPDYNKQRIVSPTNGWEMAIAMESPTDYNYGNFDISTDDFRFKSRYREGAFEATFDPPPIPTDEKGYTISTENKNLWKIHKLLWKKLEALGFRKLKIHTTEGGFIIASEVERFNIDGSSHIGPNRFEDRFDQITLSIQGAKKWLKRFFKGDLLQHRFFLFKISNEPIALSSGILRNRSLAVDVMADPSVSSISLPQSSFTTVSSSNEELYLNIYVYEFLRRDTQKIAYFNDDPVLSIEQHLERSGLLETIKTIIKYE